MLNAVKDFLKMMHKVEEALLVLFVSTMVIITFTQILLRNLTGGVAWFDILVRYLVLWSGMLAAGIATAEGRHIKIDIVGRFTKGRFKEIVVAVTAAFAGFVSLALCVVSVIYIIRIEMPSTEPAPFLNIPRWVLLVIMPFGFFMMGIRFFVRTADYSLKAYHNIQAPEESELDAFTLDEAYTVEDKTNEQKGDK